MFRVSVLVGIVALSLLTLPLFRPGSISGEQPLVPETAAVSGTPDAKPPDSATMSIVSRFERPPIAFEVNRGRAAERFPFSARGPAYSLWLAADEAVFAPLARDDLSQGAAPGGKPSALRMRLLGASPNSAVTGDGALPGKTHYFIGGNPASWRTDVPTYARVRCSQVYPGIDVEYYGNDRELEFDFVVAPGADPGAISLEFAGADRLELTPEGELLAELPGGQVTLRKPVTYQRYEGGRAEIACAYDLRDDGRVGLRLADYDRALALVIDPVLVFSTYLGGSTPTFNSDEAADVAMDQAGNAYVLGRTVTTDFPLTAGALDLTPGGSYDVFITKFDPAGAIVYSTYLGGAGSDTGGGIAIDALGNAYITGSTDSTDFPTVNPIQATKRGSHDAFVTKLNATGSALVYSTYLGGNAGPDAGLGIAVDAQGHAYVTGAAAGEFPGPTFPTTPGAFDQTPNDTAGDAFFSKLHPSGGSLIYSTLIGGGGGGVRYDQGNAIAIDSAGRACIAGQTTALGNVQANFPTTPGALQGPPPLQAITHDDAFMAIIEPAGNGAADLVYSTYLRGASQALADHALAVGLDAAGIVYVGGITGSADFPTTPGAFDTSFNGGNEDIFLMKLNPLGSGAGDLVFSTFVGTIGDDAGSDGFAAGFDMAVDLRGNVFFVGSTSWFIPLVNSLQTSRGAAFEAWLGWLNPSGSALLYSSYMGGNTNQGEFSHGVAIHGSGAVVVVGNTGSSNFLTLNAVQTTRRGPVDVFVTRFEGFDINQQPVVSCPIPITVECQDSGEAAVTLSVQVSDSDGDALSVTWFIDGQVVQTDHVPAAGPPTSQTLTLTRTLSLGDHLLSVSVSDGFVGGTPCSASTIMVVDTQAPTVTCPQQISVAADEACEGIVPDLTTQVAAVDDCTPAGSITVTQSLPAGSPAVRGAHTITVSFRDGSNNVSTCDVALEVEDGSAPMLALPTDATVGCTESTDPSATGQATAADNCDSNASIAYTDASTPGDCPQEFTIARTWSAGDAFGNTALAVQSITIEDTQAPALLDVPADVTVECDAVPPAASVAASDDCDAAPTFSLSESTTPGDCSGRYTLTRTWTTTDACGNAASASHAIAVVDTVAPTLILNADSITVTDADNNGSETVTLPGFTVADACDAAPAVVQNPPGNVFPVGSTTVTYTAGDNCGNTRTATVNVTVLAGGTPPCGTIVVHVLRHTLDCGTRPRVTRSPLVGIEVCAYDTQQMRSLCGGSNRHHYQCAIDNQSPTACGITDATGQVALQVPAGAYTIIASGEDRREECPDPIGDGESDFDDGEPDDPLGRRVCRIRCGQTKARKLIQMVDCRENKRPSKCTRRCGSELLIVEPEFVVWDQEEQLYPFVLDSSGDWGVTATVAPPEGFISDFNSLSAVVEDETEAVQFTITEVGSDLVPTGTTFDVTHHGRTERIRSKVDILLTPDYARSRGFNVAELRARGLIKEPRVRLPGPPNPTKGGRPASPK